MLDCRPPLAPFLYIFGHPVPFEITVPGRPMTAREVVWLPSRAEFANVADAALLDTMPTLAIPLTPDDAGQVPVGTRCKGPAMGETVPRVWTVRRVYASPAPDAEWAVVGVAP